MSVNPQILDQNKDKSKGESKNEQDQPIPTTSTEIPEGFLAFPEDVEDKLVELESDKSKNICKELNFNHHESIRHGLQHYKFHQFEDDDPGCQLLIALNNHLQAPGSSSITSLFLRGVTSYSRHDNGHKVFRPEAVLFPDLMAELSKKSAFSNLTEFGLEHSSVTYHSGVSGRVSGGMFYRSFPSPDLQTSYGKQLSELLNNNPTLTHFSLDGLMLGEDGGIQMAKGLKNCTKLVHLNLSSNQFGPKAGLEIANSLKACTGLKFLSLQGVIGAYNGFDAEVFLALADTLKDMKSLEKVFLSKSNSEGLDSKVYQELMEVFQNLPNLVEFSLDPPKAKQELEATRAVSTMLAKTPCLSSLKVLKSFCHEETNDEENPFSDETFSKDSKRMSLSKIDTEICSALVQGLGNNKSLRSITFCDIVMLSKPEICHSIFHALKRHPSLHSLCIELSIRNSVLPESLLDLLKANPKITDLKIYFADNRKISTIDVLFILRQLFENIPNLHMPTSLVHLMLDYLAILEPILENDQPENASEARTLIFSPLSNGQPRSDHSHNHSQSLSLENDKTSGEALEDARKKRT